MILSELQIGQKGIIKRLSHQNATISRRLMDLGMVEGSVISLKRTLPFGGPVLIELNGQLIGIRKHDTQEVEVCPL